jgi:cell division protein FtsB
MIDHDPLAELLRTADAAQPPPEQRGDVAGRVHRRARRRRAGQGLIVAALVVGVGVSVWFSRPPARHSTIASASVAQLQRECAQFDADADMHERTAQLMLSHERAAARRVAAADDRDAVTSQLERSALILVNQGERLLREPDAKSAAADAFRRVVELFPQSRGAAVARERLNQIGA